MEVGMVGCICHKELFFFLGGREGNVKEEIEKDTLVGPEKQNAVNRNLVYRM